MVFTTPHDAHALMGYFESPGKTVCDIVFDEVYVEQVSPAGALRSAGRTLLSMESCRDELLGKKSLEGEDDVCRFSFGFSWKSSQVQQELVFQWLERSGKVIGTETCRFNPMVGIQSQWSGIQTEWFRHYGDSADKVHCRRDQFFNTSTDQGSGKLDGMLIKPSGAENIRVRFTAGSNDNLEIRDFALSALSLEVQ